MTYKEQDALRALATISDPLKDTDIVAAGRLASLDLVDGVLQAVLQIPPPEADKFFAIRADAQAALEALDGVPRARVVLSAHKAGPSVGGARKRGNPHQPKRPDGRQGDRDITRVVAVSSAKGGVGKSTVAANLAVALAQSGQRIGLLDADIHGPSLPMLMGTSGTRTGTTEVDGRPLINPVMAHGITTMSIGYLTADDGPIVWRGPMVQGAISRMLWDVNWGELDTLIIDMPPGTGDAQLGLAQDIKPAGAIIVSTPQDLALLDARKGVQMFRKVDIPVLGLVENMAVFTCPDCGAAHHIFGEGGAKRDADALEIQYLGALPLDMRVRKSGDAGAPVPEIFADLAQAVSAVLPEKT